LIILFKTEKLRNEYNDQPLMMQHYGKAGAKRLGQRLTDLRAAPNLEALKGFPGNYHELAGDRKGTLAVTVDGGKRLLFEVANDPIPTRDDGGLDWFQVTAVQILGIEDYHA